MNNNNTLNQDNFELEFSAENSQATFVEDETTSSNDYLEQLRLLRDSYQQAQSVKADPNFKRYDPSHALKQSAKELYLAKKGYERFVKEQRNLNPAYDMLDYSNRGASAKFGLKFFDYTSDMANYRGELTALDINGKQYVFRLGVPTLILISDEPLILQRLTSNNYYGVPKNISRSLNMDDETRRKMIFDIAENFSR